MGTPDIDHSSYAERKYLGLFTKVDSAVIFSAPFLIILIGLVDPLLGAAYAGVTIGYAARIGLRKIKA